MEVDEFEFGQGSVAELIEAIRAIRIDTGPGGQDCFETKSPDWWPGGRTFGGMVVAQGLNAAMQTVPDGLDLHSLHAYFMRPTPPGIPSRHEVERLRDGRSFSTRQVTSEVEGKPTFRLMCQFHAPEEGEEYQLPMAGVTAPIGDARHGFGFPFEMEELGPTERRADGTYRSTRRVWFRASEQLDDDPRLHACLLAYVSDMTGAAFRPLSLDSWGTHTDASLDHSLWFHRPYRADRWTLYELEAVVNAGGRSTVRGTMHGEDGTLHTTMAQELLIRKLEVPLIFGEPAWLERQRKRLSESQQEEGIDGTA
jgi:acyl-CoA thioesterase II